MIPDRFIFRSGTCQLQDSTAFTCRVHCNDMAMTMISALAAIFDAILSWTSDGYGSKPWHRAVNPKIAGKWMFIPLKLIILDNRF